MSANDRKPAVLVITNWALLLGGLFCIGAGCYNLISGNAGLAGTGLGSGIVFLFGATIERFESLKGMSLEVKTRKIDEKLMEANKIIKDLKQLAEVTSHTLSVLAAKVGRWSSPMSFEESNNLAKKIREILTSLGCSEQDIKSALQPWVEITLLELTVKLTKPIQTELQELLKSTQKELHNFHQPIDPTDSNYLILIENANQLSNHKVDFETLSIENLKTMLSRYGSDAPLLSKERKATYLAELESWFPEIDHLIMNSSIKSYERWSLALKREG